MTFRVAREWPRPLVKIERAVSVTASLICLIASGCSDSVAPSPLRPPTSMSAFSPLSITAVAGSSLWNQASVIVKGEAGVPVAGVTVTFTLLAGAGSISGSSSRTNMAGIATLAEWKLSPKAGLNTVVATVDSLLPVFFTVVGTPGPPLRLVKVVGDRQTAPPWTAVPVAPRVKVEDANENPISGIAVTFTITSGDGSVGTPRAVSNSGGYAEADDWTLGTKGIHTLSATVDGIPAALFTATSGVPCLVTPALVIGSAVAATLAETDCSSFDGNLEDIYTLSVEKTGVYSFEQISPAFGPHVSLTLDDGTPVAEADNRGGVEGSSSFKALLPAGSYRISASSAAVGLTGAYTIGVKQEPFIITNCEKIFVARPVTVDETLSDNDCFSSDERISDQLLIYLVTGTHFKMTASLAVGIDAPYLELYDPAGAVVAKAIGGYYKDATLIYDVPVSGYYLIRVADAEPSSLASYTLKIE